MTKIPLYHCANCAKFFTSREIDIKNPGLCPKCGKRSFFDEPLTKLQQEYLDYVDMFSGSAWNFDEYCIARKNQKCMDCGKETKNMEDDEIRLVMMLKVCNKCADRYPKSFDKKIQG